MRWASGILAVPALLATAADRAEAYSTALTTIGNPDWEILVTDYGYSDLLFDKRTGYEGREYLSGEWGGAVGYSRAGATVSPTWFDPTWVFPDWTTNSDFAVTSALMSIGTNASGFDIFASTIANADLAITQRLEMIDTTMDGGAGPTGPGVEQGLMPPGGPPGASATSDRYILRQSYTVTNLTAADITGVQLFQFLHGLNSTTAVYDDRPYGAGVTPWWDYRYDTTLRGTSGSPDGAVHDDIISFHSKEAPSAWEVGSFGTLGVDSHEVGKPSTGVHLSVEGNSLSGTSFYGPSLWVSGAQRYELGALAPGASAHIDVLLSLQTTTTEVPEPAGFLLIGAGLAGVLVRRRGRIIA